ncbi:MAG: hypothetical protein HY905_09770 [Deltaproteobacteria bacterium]|nr:hypothetical protein [Deltaproteobacteria bacterium]
MKEACFAIVLVVLGGCSAGGEADDYMPDIYHPEATDGDADAGDPGARPDGLSLDSPLPDGYGLEMSEGGDGCGIRNACGGCTVLRYSPGQACGGCGGTYECNGPDELRCVGGCSPVGCADLTREGFLSTEDWPEIAACGGGFEVAGVLHSTPTCDRDAGNTSTNPMGTGCSAADLCAMGWRLCASAAEVGDRTRSGGVPSDWAASTFFAAAVSGPADDEVCGIGENDVYGIGSAGGGADRATCAPLTRTSSDKCDDLPSPWDCGDVSTVWQYDEATQITKLGPQGGGVLCCLAPD